MNWREEYERLKKENEKLLEMVEALEGEIEHLHEEIADMEDMYE